MDLLYLSCQLLQLDLINKLLDQKIIPVGPELKLAFEAENQYGQLQN